jgi:hypothetical protein
LPNLILLLSLALGAGADGVAVRRASATPASALSISTIFLPFLVGELFEKFARRAFASARRSARLQKQMLGRCASEQFSF